MDDLNFKSSVPSFFDEIVTEYKLIKDEEIMTAIHIFILMSLWFAFCVLLPEDFELFDPVLAVRNDIMEELIDPYGFHCNGENNEFINEFIHDCKDSPEENNNLGMREKLKKYIFKKRKVEEMKMAGLREKYRKSIDEELLSRRNSKNVKIPEDHEVTEDQISASGDAKSPSNHALSTMDLSVRKYDTGINPSPVHCYTNIDSFLEHPDPGENECNDLIDFNSDDSEGKYIVDNDDVFIDIDLFID